MTEIKACVDRYLPEHVHPQALERAVGENPVNAPLPQFVEQSPQRLVVVTGRLWQPGRVLRVSFIGNPPVRTLDKVVRHATEWERHANIKFQFVRDANAEIRVAFLNQGAWSYIGTDALSVAKGVPTMNLGWIDEATVLHEFGHALGCTHEHQSPAANIPWNIPAVYRYYAGPPNYWDKATVDANLFARYSREQTNFSAFDRRSIMLYPLAVELLTDPSFAVGWNRQLSPGDIAHIGKVYPQPKPALSRVQNVITADTKRDITTLINEAAERHGFSAVGFLGGLIGESNLHERASRERAWPDVSYGLSQPTVAFLHPDSGLQLQRNAQGVAVDSAENRRLVRDWAFDAANLIPYTARRYAELIQRFGATSPLEAWTRWNAPGRTLAENEKAQPHAIQNYRRGLAEAEKYRAGGGTGGTGTVIDIRGTLPELGWGKKYGRRRLDQIIGSVIHFTDGPRNQSIRAVAEWQISDGAKGQTGTKPPQPFPALAYHYMVKGDGQPHLCHDLETVTWHAAEPANSERIAICFTGKGAPTTEQINGMARAHVSAERTLGRRLSAIPHKQVVRTNCPGNWDAWSGQLFREIERLRQPEPPPPTADITPELEEFRRHVDLDAAFYIKDRIVAKGRRDVGDELHQGLAVVKNALEKA